MTNKPLSNLRAELSAQKNGSKLNWLRAAVLGANDGIVSVASIVLGVAGASNSRHFILTAGFAGMVAGALSMAVGEYVSVSSQRDAEKAMLEKERMSLMHSPDEELEELADIYRRKGLSEATARRVAEELTTHDAFTAHLHAEYNIDPEDIVNPGHAAFASALSFFCGALIPLFAILLPRESWRVPVTFFSVLVALVITGALSAQAGGASKRRAIIRVVAGGVIAMAVTYGVGIVFGTFGI